MDPKETRRRLAAIRKKNPEQEVGDLVCPGANAVEQLVFEVLRVPTLRFSGNDRSKDNTFVFQNGKKRHPDFRLDDAPDKVVEMVGTYSHAPAWEYAEQLKEEYSSIGVDVLPVIEDDFIKDPERWRRTFLAFYGKCPHCGGEVSGDPAGPVTCSRCGHL